MKNESISTVKKLTIGQNLYINKLTDLQGWLKCLQVNKLTDRQYRKIEKLRDYGISDWHALN